MVKCLATLAVRSKDKMPAMQLEQIGLAVLKECEKKSLDYKLLTLPSLTLLLDGCTNVNLLTEVYELVSPFLGFDQAKKEDEDEGVGSKASEQLQELRLASWQMLVKALRNATGAQVAALPAAWDRIQQAMAATQWKVKVQVLAAVSALGTKLMAAPDGLDAGRLDIMFRGLAKTALESQQGSIRRAALTTMENILKAGIDDLEVPSAKVLAQYLTDWPVPELLAQSSMEELRDAAVKLTALGNKFQQSAA